MQAGKIFSRFQRIDWLQPSIIALVLSNLVPLAGVFLFRWQVFPLLFLFWLENVVIGIFNVLKMLLAGSFFDIPAFNQILQQRAAQTSGKNLIAGAAIVSFSRWAAKLFLSAFFCVHYGMFTFVHGALLVALFDGAAHRDLLNVPMIFQIIRENYLEWPLVALVVSHLVSFGYDYLWRDEFRRTSASEQMMRPYGRILVMHFTLIFGGVLMASLHSPVAGLAFLVGLKIIFDLHGHQKEREKLASPESKAMEMVASQMQPVLATPEMARLKKTFLIGAAIAMLAFIPLIFGAWHFVKFFLPPTQNTSAVSVANTLTIASKKPNAIWRLDLSNAKIPDAPAAGKFRGEDFAVNRATFRNGTLNFHSRAGGNERELAVIFHLADGETIDGKSYQISPRDESAADSIQIKMRWRNGRSGFVTQPYLTGYAMRLEFGARIKNAIPAKIYLCLPDAQKSYFLGNFKVIVRKNKTGSASRGK